MKNYKRREAIRLASACTGLVFFTGCKPEGNSKENKPETGSGYRVEETETDLNDAMSREKIMSLLDQRVSSIMQRSHHCAQTSFLSLKEQFNLEDGGITKALTPLPGLGEKGGTCGAVTGCLMCLGLIFGRDRLDDWETYRKSLVPAAEFTERFKEIRGSLNCGDIVETEFGKRYDLLDPDDHKEYVRQGATEKCTKVVLSGVRIAADIILRDKYKK